MRQSDITKSRIIKHLCFEYDKLNDLLYIYKKNANVYSNVEIGDIHVEFDKYAQVIGVEILRASEILKEYKISKRILENIDNVDLKIVARNNLLMVFIIISALNQEKEAAITLNNLGAPIMEAAST